MYDFLRTEYYLGPAGLHEFQMVGHSRHATPASSFIHYCSITRPGFTSRAAQRWAAWLARKDIGQSVESRICDNAICALLNLEPNNLCQSIPASCFISSIFLSIYGLGIVQRRSMAPYTTPPPTSIIPFPSRGEESRPGMGMLMES